jgi:large subunit ribosomal protein L13
MGRRPRRAGIFTMKTYSPKPEHIERRWYVMDAGQQVLGRVASEAAVILRGKHKPIYAPHMDVGDHLIIVNAAKVVLTGGKETKKVAWRHSGHPGGITGTLYEDLLAKKPAFAVEKAIRGMLPKNRLGRAMIKKLHVVPGPEHPHRAQKPTSWTIGTRPTWEGLPTPEIEPTGGKGAPARKVVAEGSDVAAPTEPAARRKPRAKKTTATSRKTATKKTTATTKKTAARASSKKRTTTTRRSTAAGKTSGTRRSSTSTRKKDEA